MKRFFLGLAAAGILSASVLSPGVPAVAGPLDTSRFSFTEQQSGYQVRARRNAAGTMYLRGQHPDTGETFRLRVSAGGHVTGEFEGQRVDYVMGEETSETMLASR